MSSGASVCARHGAVGALDAFLEPFVSELAGLGYSVGVVRKKRAVVAAFAGWVGDHQRDVTAIDEAAVEAFLGGSGGGDPGSCGGRRRALLGFLEHLRAAGVTARPAPVSDESSGALLEMRYRSYLRCERGLVEGTVACYGLYVGEFVREHFATTAATATGHPLDAADVRGFLLRRARSVTPRTAQLVATALRSFLRFLFLQGVTTLNLALAILANRASW